MLQRATRKVRRASRKVRRKADRLMQNELTD